MIGPVPLAFIGAYVYPALVTHTHRRSHCGGEINWSRLCRKNCRRKELSVYRRVDLIAFRPTRRRRRRIRPGAGAGVGPGACLLFVCLTDLLLFILISGSNTPTLKEHGLCAWVPAAFDFYIDCVVAVAAGGPWVLPAPQTPPLFVSFVDSAAYVSVSSVCLCSRLVLTNRQGQRQKQRQHRMQPSDSSVIQ